MLTIVTNFQGQFPVFLVINVTTGKLVKECFSLTEAEKIQKNTEEELAYNV